jgi:prophage maintenance system killer protein
MSENVGGEPGSELLLYTSADGAVSVEVRLEGETVWLTYDQMAMLFGRDKSVVAKHARAALKEGEVFERSFRQNLPKTSGGRPAQSGDLDVIISVGYRVKSAEGVRFRRWATTVLREHLTRGYTVNERRLEQLHQALRIVARSDYPEIAGMANVLKLYADGLTLLDDYDHRQVSKPSGKAGGWKLDYDEALAFVGSMRFREDSELFGVERDGSFASSVATIYQGWDGVQFYPTVQEKAANLLYLVVKNHSFVDGNKRIAAGLFVHFLERNGILWRADGTLVIDNAALAGLTLMIALSDPVEKDIMCALVVNCLGLSS